MKTKNAPWYKNLKKSPLNPPSWVFGVVWPLLYTSLIIYFFLNLFNPECSGLCDRLIFFLVQVFFNLIWPLAFFKLREIKMSFVILIIMDILTFVTIYLTPDMTKYILYPYMGWILFATYLTGYIVWNN
jgi:tryptophan-rich sensory protein